MEDGEVYKDQGYKERLRLYERLVKGAKSSRNEGYNVNELEFNFIKLTNQINLTIHSRSRY